MTEGDLGWIVVLWGGLFIFALLTRSVIANVALIFVSMLGFSLSHADVLVGWSSSVVMGMRVIFLMVVGFAMYQIVAEAKRI